MAKPIKNTPVLTGKDAINFSTIIKNNKDKKVSKEELLAVKEAGQLFKRFIKA